MLIGVLAALTFVMLLNSKMSRDYCSTIVPLVEMVTTLQGMTLPLACNAFRSANSSPLQ